MTILSRVANVFHEAFAVPAENVTIDTVPEDVAKWDSLGHMNMVSVLEREFGVPFEVEEIMEMATVRAIVDIVSAKGIKD